MASRVFYSWQSDLPNATNRGFIEMALQRAVRAIAADGSIEVEPVLDRDSVGVPGSPDIAATIFQKVANCAVFVCDVTPIGRVGARAMPNPNVLVELGYAIRAVGWDRIVLVLNRTHCAPEELPFDFRGRRPVQYEMAVDAQRADERRRLESALTEALRLIFTTVDSAKAAGAVVTPRDLEWRDQHRAQAFQGLRSLGMKMSFEAFAVAADPRVSKTQAELLAAARAARVEVVDDVPIGFMNGVRPHPAADGIVNEIRNDELSLYQYWALRRDGSFYVLHSMWEEKHKPGLVLYDKRIARTAELLLYLHRLHAQLGTPPERPIGILVHYEEIAGTQLGNLARGGVSHAPSHENVADANAETVVAALRDRTLEHTRALTEPVFMLFDYFVVGDESYRHIVDEIARLI